MKRTCNSELIPFIPVEGKLTMKRLLEKIVANGCGLDEKLISNKVKALLEKGYFSKTKTMPRYYWMPKRQMELLKGEYAEKLSNRSSSGKELAQELFNRILYTRIGTEHG